MIVELVKVRSRAAPMANELEVPVVWLALMVESTKLRSLGNMSATAYELIAVLPVIVDLTTVT